MKTLIKNTEEKNDYIINIILLIGSLSFLTIGLISKLHTSSVINEKIIFFPQGLTMCIYGIIGTIIASYQVSKIINKITKQT
jgi:hypothetical protein